MDTHTISRSHFLVTTVGFALFLVVSAIQVWGGVFSFVIGAPENDTMWFTVFTLQGLACIATFGVAIARGYLFPSMSNRIAIGVFSLCMLAASIMALAGMRGGNANVMVLMLAALLSGCASAGLALQWQRIWSAMSQDASNTGILVGTMLAGAMYFVLNLMPASASAILLPSCVAGMAGCLLYAEARMDLVQPMFEDIPKDYPRVYTRLVHDLWRTVICVAAIAFSCGLARGFAVAAANGAGLADLTSALGSIVSALLLFVLSRTLSLRFGISRMFRFIFPLMIVAALIFPFLRSTGLNLFTGLTHILFSLSLLVLMMQAAQISRDRGASPTFVFALFCTALYAAQVLGFTVGWVAHKMPGFIAGESVVLSLAGSAAMGMALFAMTRGFAIPSSSEGRADEVEFLQVSQSRVRVPKQGGEETQRPSHADAYAVIDTTQLRNGSLDEAQGLLLDAPSAPRVTDRISKQCVIARQQFGLSTRETEVMEHIARGHSVPAIAQVLSISENTVRTHSKHIYTKLDVHSKSQLSELLDTMDVADFDYVAD